MNTENSKIVKSDNKSKFYLELKNLCSKYEKDLTNHEIMDLLEEFFMTESE